MLTGFLQLYWLCSVNLSYCETWKISFCWSAVFYCLWGTWLPHVRPQDLAESCMCTRRGCTACYSGHRSELHSTIQQGVGVQVSLRVWTLAAFPHQSCSQADLIEHLLFCPLRTDLERASKSRVASLQSDAQYKEDQGVFFSCKPWFNQGGDQRFFTNRPSGFPCIP